METKIKSIILLILMLTICFVSPTHSKNNNYEPATIQITTIEGLNATRNNLSATYILMNNLDFNDDYFYDNPSNKSGFITGSGWSPITVFNGSFNGQNFTIANLFINRSGTDNIGLFGQISNYSEINNVCLTTCNVTGQSYVGGLVGYNDGTIFNCYSTGVINGKNAFPYSHIGGLVGYNIGSISNGYSKCNVTGYSNIGGFVGTNYPSGVISKCYANGNINSTTSEGGGFVGHNFQGIISNCYANSSVIGVNVLGGFIGFMNQGTISRCYSAGYVNGSGVQIGGFVGFHNGGTESDCFWDINTSGQLTSMRGTGKTTAQMKNYTTFYSAGWDIVKIENFIDQIWRIDDGNDYPHLGWEFEPLPWDILIDRVINYLDVSSLINHYGHTGTPHWIRDDINDDGDVNYLDVSLLVTHYGEEY